MKAHQSIHKLSLGPEGSHLDGMKSTQKSFDFQGLETNQNVLDIEHQLQYAKDSRLRRMRTSTL
ncbi:MAG: hypothetical protein DMG06_11270 [Acidobacteria bacterium]|nr:MAG: hypothetical protein DMG06_11270 [Acidobacteriota bacterium]